MDRERLFGEIRALEEQLETDNGANGLIEPLREAFSFGNQAFLAFEQAGPEQKRAILKRVSSNLVLKEKKVLVQAKEAFDVLRTVGRIPDSQPQRESDPCFLIESEMS